VEIWGLGGVNNVQIDNYYKWPRTDNRLSVSMGWTDNGISFNPGWTDNSFFAFYKDNRIFNNIRSFKLRYVSFIIKLLLYCIVV